MTNRHRSQVRALQDRKWRLAIRRHTDLCWCHTNQILWSSSHRQQQVQLHESRVVVEDPISTWRDWRVRYGVIVIHWAGALQGMISKSTIALQRAEAK